MDVDDTRAANRANWDERVAHHLRAYDVDGFFAGQTMLQLMCHQGVPT